MKLIKISQDHYVIVDDSQIKEGDYLYSFSNNKVVVANKLTDLYVHSKKITHSTQPIDGDGTGACFIDIKQLPIQEVKELIGEVDVEKKIQSLKNNFGYSTDDYYQGAEDGYNQALEDNKDRKYTEKDMVEAFKMGLMKLSDQRLKDYMQPKTEWEVEFIDGQLKQRQ